MNFSVEAKCPIDIFKKSNLDCSWSTVQVGWDLGRLSIDEIKKFALDFSERYPESINQYIAEIIFSKDKYEVDNLLKKIIFSLNLEFPTSNTSSWNKEWLKWRYCILYCMAEQIQDAEELLIKAEGLYADFGYPEDMIPFIYYMPADEELMHLKPEEARAILVTRLKSFLKEERNKIQ